MKGERYRITVEYFGRNDREDNPTHLGIATIVDDGTSTLKLGNYDVKLSRRYERNRTWRTGRVEGFPRQGRNTLGGPTFTHWDLLYRALKSTIGGRNR